MCARIVMLEMVCGRLWTMLAFNLLRGPESLRFTIPVAIAKLHGNVSNVGFLGVLTVAHIYGLCGLQLT